MGEADVYDDSNYSMSLPMDWFIDFNTSDRNTRYRFHADQPPRVIAMVLCVMAMILNSGSLLAISKLQRSLSPNLRLIISLSLSDMLLCLSMVLKMEVTNPLVRNNCTDMLIHSLVIMAHILSLLNLLGLALDHYMALVRPLRYPIVMRSGRANAMIATFWLLAGICGFSDLIVPSLHIIRCDHLYSQTLNYTVKYSMCDFAACSKNISEYIMFVLALVCFLIMTVFYVRVYMKIFKQQRIRCNQSSLVRRNKRGVVTTFFIMGTFVVCWLPYCILEIALTIQIEMDVSVVIRYFNYILITDYYLFILVILNSLCDPIIYAVRMREVQRGYNRLLKPLSSLKARVQNRQGHRISLGSTSTSSSIPICANRGSRQSHTHSHNQEQTLV